MNRKKWGKVGHLKILSQKLFLSLDLDPSLFHSVVD